MQNWVGVVVAIALVLQVSVLIALFVQTRRTMKQVEDSVTDLNRKVGPVLTRVQILLDDTQPKISTMVSDGRTLFISLAGRRKKWIAFLPIRRTVCAGSLFAPTAF